MSPVTLMIIGLIVGFLSFAFAGINAYRAITSGESFDLGSLFRGHIGAMIGTALGGVIFMIGLVIWLTQLLS